MLEHLNLKQKLTILLSIVVVVGLSLGGLALSTVLKHNARQEVTATALLIMETMTSVREYTNQQVQLELADKLAVDFVPQSIPAYSAREVFELLRKKNKYEDFFYKEATLNPTNLRDKADGFETQIVDRFRKNLNLKQLDGFRELPGGSIFYIARPLSVTESKCLVCHSTPNAAPKTMIDRYGTVNGFGWKLHEIIGAQVISIPASKVMQKTQQSSFWILGIVSIMFIAVTILVNIFLNHQILRPLKRITRVAEEVSMGHMDADFENISNDEIGKLAKAFHRMKLSLEMAMRKLKQFYNSTEN
jgi:HAMP domain-containing protein